MGIGYVALLTENVDIWGQAIFMGILVVGVGCLSGFAIHSTIQFFKMLSH